MRFMSNFSKSAKTVPSMQKDINGCIFICFAISCKSCSTADIFPFHATTFKAAICGANMRTGICGVKIWSTFQFYIKRIVFGILDLLITADIIENTGESLDGISSIRIGDPSEVLIGWLTRILTQNQKQIRADIVFSVRESPHNE